MDKVTLKEKYCCPEVTEIMRDLVGKFNGSREDLVQFEKFFEKHMYTNLDAWNRFYNKETWEIDIELLLDKVFETAALFSPAIQDYFFACFDKDAKRTNANRRGEADYYILRKKIEERRQNSNMQGQAKPEKALPKTFAELFKTPDGETLAIKAMQRVGLVDEDATQWRDERTTGAIRAVFEALQDKGLIHKIELTPGCKLIAKRFGVKVVKNYPKASFTQVLRQEIKPYLTQQG
jgi:hypothetical protein